MDINRIDKLDKILCAIVRFLRGSRRCPKWLIKRSIKKYGRLDSLARFWWQKYCDIEIGKYSYGYQSLSHDMLKSVGSFTSIAGGVRLVPNNHKMDYVTTSPILAYKEFGFISKDFIQEYDPGFVHSITIGNDVWIGENCIIFEHVNIGDGAVIAAGSIVRKDVPPYAIIGGVDRLIKYRFSQSVIEKLLVINWWNWEETKIKENIDLMYNIDQFVDKHYIR